MGRKKIHFNNLSAHTHHTGAGKKQGNFQSNRSLFSKPAQKHEAVGLRKSCSARISGVSAAALQNSSSEEEREIRKEKVFTKHLLSWCSGICAELPRLGAFGCHMGLFSSSY